MDPTVADSLQAARDTLVLVQGQSTSWLEWVSLGVSVLIAVFTGGYLYYTTKIFGKTKKQAQAAQKSAKASHKSAEAAQEANRIEKRATFYPIFDLDLGFYNNNASKLDISISLLNENMIFESEMIILLWLNQSSIKDGNDKGYFDIEFGPPYDPPLSLLSDIEIGNITKNRKVPVDVHESPYGVDFLLKFQDALGNSYYRYQSFEVNQEAKPVEANCLRTEAARMRPCNKVFKIYLDDNGYSLKSLSSIENNDIYDPETTSRPSSVAKFDSTISSGTVGTFGDAIVFTV